MNTTNSVLDLVAAMTRAKENGATDEEARQLKAASDIGQAIWDVCSKHHKDSGGPLDTMLCLRSVAIALAVMIRRHRLNTAVGVLVAVELSELIIATATEK